MVHRIAVVQLAEAPEAWSVVLDGSRVLTFSGPFALVRARERSAEIDQLIHDGESERQGDHSSERPASGDR